MRRFLFLVLLFLASPALAQKPPINGVAGPTTSSQLRGIITDEIGTGAALFGGAEVGNLNYLAPFSNSVSRTQNAKDADVVSPKDFGNSTTCNGVQDDTAALQRAAATGRSVMLPSTSCVLTGTMSFTVAGQCLLGQGQDISVIKMSGSATVSFAGGADGGCGDGFTLDGQNLMSANSVLLDINHRSNLNFSNFALRNADTAVHIYGSSLRIRFSHYLFRGAGSAGSIRQVWLNGVSDADRVQNVNFDNGDIAPLTAGTSMIVADGAADSIVINNVGFSATNSLPAQYGIWATRNGSYVGTAYPSFIKYWGRGMENLQGSPIRLEGGSHFWIQNTYLSSDGEDDGLYIGASVVDDVVVTGNLIRGNGRNGVNMLAGRGVISGNLIVNNGGNSGASFPVAITSAVDNGAGLYRVLYTPVAAWTARANDIVTIAGSVGGSADGTWYITPIDSTHFDLQASTFSGNAAGGSGTLVASGIRVGAAVDELQVSSNVIGRMLGGTNRQAYGAWIETGATNVTARNNWMRFNTVAPIFYDYSDPSVLIGLNGGDDESVGIVTATAGTTVLTGGSKPQQNLIGSTTQTYQLPAATTLNRGTSFTFINSSTGTMTINDGAGALVATLLSGGSGTVTATSVLTTAGTWRFRGNFPSHAINSSTVPALTLTQSGNAPVAVFNNNNGTLPTTLSGSGLWQIGSSTALTQNGSSINAVQLAGTGQASATFAQSAWVTATASAAAHVFSRSRFNTAIGTHSAVISGNLLGTIGWEGSDGTGFIPAASIRSEVDGTPGTNDMPGRIVFATTADGAAAVTDRATIDNKGNVIINTAAIATNATDGFLYVPSSAGPPTGTPTTYTGRVPIVVDTTNNKLYFYSTGVWRDAGP